MKTNQLTGTAILLAISLIAQSARYIVPVPPFMSMFGIGTIVSACMVLALIKYDVKSALVIAWVSPIVAFLQNMLPLLPFVFIVGLGNSLYVCTLHWMRRVGLLGRIIMGASVKCATLYGGFIVFFMAFSVPVTVQSKILLVMGWPQLITASLGILLANFIYHRAILGVSK